MSLFYKLAYTIGLKPWEEMATLPIAEQIHALFDREENEREPPYGAMPDIGCGSGIWAARLASRGWQVTGIDIVPKALRKAHQRIQQAGVDATLIEGDLTAPRDAGIGSGFHFILDLGVIHGLNDTQRMAAGREISAVTAPDATMILLAWVPGRRGPLPRGMSRDDIQSVFSEWDIIDEQTADLTDAPGFIKKVRPHFYRLRRTKAA